jgi:hypothetical protein
MELLEIHLFLRGKNKDAASILQIALQGELRRMQVGSITDNRS